MQSKQGGRPYLGGHVPHRHDQGALHGIDCYLRFCTVIVMKALTITPISPCSRCPTWHHRRRNVLRSQLLPPPTTALSRPLRIITRSSSVATQGPAPSSSTSSRPSCTSRMWVILLQMDSALWYDRRRDLQRGQGKFYIFPSQYLFTAALKGFGLSFASHYLIEGNQPATFHRPVMSVMGDHQMCIDLVILKLRMW